MDYDPHENDPQERKDPDMDRHDDSDQGKDDGGEILFQIVCLGWDK